jgi:hypothetical protein
MLSDAEMIVRGGPELAIGMSEIKQNRMRFPVKCHEGDTVGEYDLTQLDEIDWPAVRATDFRDARVKEGKQAELLVRRFCPWSLIERVGVRSETVQRQVLGALQDADHQPPVDVLGAWYF